MSKAFTRESDYDPTQEVRVRPRDVLPPGQKNYITPVGAARMRASLEAAQEARPRLLEELRALAAAGKKDDEAHRAGQRRLRDLEERIAWLAERVAGLEIVEPRAHGDARVRFGATVTVLDEDGDEHRYRIVGVDEADAERGDVSWLSPLARALLGGEEGDEVTVSLPRGSQRLEIAAVRYEQASVE